MTRSLRMPLLATHFFLSSFYCSFLEAQRPSQRYQAAVQAGRLEPRVRAFVAACLGTRALPRPRELYSQGSWFVVSNLAPHIREQGSADDGTAQVWFLSSRPRAVSLWTHDDEFDRSTLACLDDKGTVTRQVNAYMPGLSEPELHYISIHTFTLTAGGQYRSASRYTDWNGRPVTPPKLTSEDRDFIAGERRYKQWNDFDFASAMQRAQ